MVRPRFCRVIYYFDTPTLGRRHQLFGRVMAHVDNSSTLSGILNLERVVWPPGSKRDAIPDEATTRTSNPSDLMRSMIVCHKKVLPVPLWPWTKNKLCFFWRTAATTESYIIFCPLLRRGRFNECWLLRSARS